MNRESELIWEAYNKSNEIDIVDLVKADPMKYMVAVYGRPDQDWDGNYIEREEGFVYTNEDKLLGRVWGTDLEEIKDALPEDRIIERD